ncbi:hypothetical protein C446_06820 [Halobiforma nitratireducens JCM 10879]|uniref:Uncharacterized protein n=1 Tax=Halobiforma nitratireducens JCM 10879 TaxID=1227454 RepID=M0M8C9_9EURY|nr:hypothetical protein C446_06820 [Halobiforma nitratireducens JCM 10879]
MTRLTDSFSRPSQNSSSDTVQELSLIHISERRDVYKRQALDGQVDDGRGSKRRVREVVDSRDLGFDRGRALECTVGAVLELGDVVGVAEAFE